MKPKRISKIQYDRIDRVDAGAQPGAHVTLVKARRRVEKILDPASIDAKVQSVRDAFRDQYSNGDYGCCTPCSGYVYVDAVYDGFVIACDSNGEYWRFVYSMGGRDQDTDDVTFDTPTNVTPTVTWSPDADDDTPAPVPVMKGRKLWEAPMSERVVRVTKWTDTPAARKKLAAMDPPQALSDGSYPMPNSDYVNKAIDAIGRAGNKRPMVIALARRRAKELSMDLSGSSIPELSGKKTTKEHKMPNTMPDLSALDEDARVAVEAAFAENETLAAEKTAFEAAVAATPPVEALDDDDDALDTVEGLEKAIKKSRSPEQKRLLKAALAAAKENADMRDSVTKLQKAERIRLFKERARVVGHIAAHADDGVEGLAGLLETIDSGCGSDTADAVEAILTKSHNQVHELMDKKGLLKSVGRIGGDEAGMAMILSTSQEGQAVETIQQGITELKKANPELTDAQAMTRVLKANPHLYAEATAR